MKLPASVSSSIQHSNSTLHIARSTIHLDPPHSQKTVHSRPAKMSSRGSRYGTPVPVTASSSGATTRPRVPAPVSGLPHRASRAPSTNAAHAGPVLRGKRYSWSSDSDGSQTAGVDSRAGSTKDTLLCPTVETAPDAGSAPIETHFCTEKQYPRHCCLDGVPAIGIRAK